jgi:hypothetical protein
VRSLRNLLSLFFLALVLVLAACGDDDNNNNGDRQDAGGDQGADGGADQGTADNGAPDQGTPDQGTGCDEVSTRCYTPLPSSSGFPRVMLNALNLANNWVEIKNVNTVNADLTGWFVCQRPNCQPLPGALVLAPSQVIRIHLNQTGTSTASEIYLPLSSPLTREDEIAFYSSEDFDSSDAIEVYLRWGSPANGGGRSVEAAAAGLWRQGNFVPVCGDNTGIVATGDGFFPIGFHDVPGTCPAMR